MPLSESSQLLPSRRSKLRYPLFGSQYQNRRGHVENGDFTSESDALNSDDSLSDDAHDESRWSAFEKLLWLSKPTVVKIGVVMLLVELALGVAAPAEQVVYYKLACQYVKNASGNDKCDEIEVQRIVTNFVMWNEIILSGVLIATTAKVCLLLDIYGRKTFLTFFSVAAFLGKSMIYIAMSWSRSMPAIWMWLGLMISLIFGGIQGLSSLCKAYVADISRPQDRISNLGFAMVFSNIGLLGGPALLGALLTLARKVNLGKPHNDVPLLELVPIQAGLLFLAILILVCLFVLPESRSRESERQSEIEQNEARKAADETSNWRGHLRSLFTPLKILTFPPEYQNKRNKAHFRQVRMAVLHLVAVNCLLLLISETVVTISKQYCIYKYGWDAVMLLNNLILNGVCNMLVYLVVSPLLVKRVFPKLGLESLRYLLDQGDTALLVACSLTNFTAVLGRAFAPNTSTFLVLCVLDSFSVLSVPTLAAAMIKFYPSLKTGELYGALALAQSIVALIFPPALSQLFSLGVLVNFPGLPFVGVSVFCLVSLGGVLRARMLVENSLG